MNGLLAVSRAIDAVNTRLGKWLSWLIVLAVLVSATNAIIRKLFDTSSNAWLELQWVLFGVVFLLCSPWTLCVNEHIRIDVISNLLSRRARTIIDIIGHAFFLLPLTVLMIVTSVPFFLRSYEINEQSFSAGGLPQWPAKFLVPLGFTLLLLQAISELIKRIAVLTERIPDPYGTVSTHAAEAEAERLLAELKTDSNPR